MIAYEPSKEFENAMIQLRTGGGEIIGLAARNGNAKAKAVIDMYQLMYKHPDHAAETLFLAALEDFKKSLPTKE